MEKISRHNDKLRICFVVHLAYGAMVGRDRGHIGGVERQTSLMARWFAARGYMVSMLTWDEGQEDGVEIDGVRVFKMCCKDAGIKGLRFLWPKWTSLITAMKRADADVYYQNCSECVTGQVALWCRRHGRRFIYSAASNRDCETQLLHLNTRRERILYQYGLRNADKVIVQSQQQKKTLKANYGRDSVILPMLCPGPNEGDYTGREHVRNGSHHILWIGRICEVKRPDRLLDLAEACPELNFDFVGPAADTEYARNVCRRAKTISNVTVHGSATRESVPEFYKQARILCCTSDSEGFPNTFLEAWSYGLPIVSTFDPDNLIAERGLGKVGKNVSELAACIRALIGSPQRWRKASQAARQHYLDHHTVDAVMAKYEKVLIDVSRKPISGGSEMLQS